MITSHTRLVVTARLTVQCRVEFKLMYETINETALLYHDRRVFRRLIVIFTHWLQSRLSHHRPGIGRTISHSMSPAYGYGTSCLFPCIF